MAQPAQSSDAIGVEDTCIESRIYAEAFAQKKPRLAVNTLNTAGLLACNVLGIDQCQRH